MSELKWYQSGCGGSSTKAQSWYVADKQGRVYICRTHPSEMGRYLIQFLEGKKHNLEFDLSSGDLRLFRDLLNSMPEDEKL